MSNSKAARRAASPQKSGRSVWMWAGLAVVAVVTAVVMANLRPGAGGLPQEISVAEAKTQRDAGAFMLDVREPSEWNEFHMPDATLIPLGQLSSRVAELPKDQPIVVVCRSGNRSQEGRDVLLRAGFTQVTSMAGGMNEWRAAGYPVAAGP